MSSKGNVQVQTFDPYPLFGKREFMQMETLVLVFLVPQDDAKRTLSWVGGRAHTFVCTCFSVNRTSGGGVRRILQGGIRIALHVFVLPPGSVVDAAPAV